MAGRTKIHDVVAADGAVVDDDVPSPKRDCIPLEIISVCAPLQATCRPFLYLLDLESLLAIIFGISVSTLTLGGGNSAARGVCHIYVGHGDDVYGG